MKNNKELLEKDEEFELHVDTSDRIPETKKRAMKIDKNIIDTVVSARVFCLCDHTVTEVSVIKWLINLSSLRLECWRHIS